MTTLSVVLATFHGARWLPDQLASLADQTRRPDELVVSDDGSDDGTPEILADFARRAPFDVRVLQGPRTGLADNFRHALTASCGDVIAWCDQDDVWLPAKLARCLDTLDETGADLVHHAARVVDADAESLGFNHPDPRRTICLEPLQGDPWHVPSGFATVFRRSLLDGLRHGRGLDRAAWETRPNSHQTLRRMNHDHVVSLVAFARGRRCELAEELALYRQHGANAAGAPTVRGAAAWWGALSIGADEFAVRAAAARGYGIWLQSAGIGSGAYFERLARRWERRAETYRDTDGAALPVRVTRGLGALARRATGHHDYTSTDRGGMGAAALAKDALATVIGTH
ncbi:glycosyltransferase [Actinomycetospora termitidis]|uniref:Glycosyltransferase n=1 Tax=Actinomycetospora termitidis TaxID=3053470 RepID=A0ABT7MFU3_9PSEU|nr:glycosyltransferase [Actinomycetospora sp. Odt1-22]MDL5159548.1 glycosyltransferase [Actinomycetospora sp. Odt1-22]